MIVPVDHECMTIHGSSSPFSSSRTMTQTNDEGFTGHVDRHTQRWSEYMMEGRQAELLRSPNQKGSYVRVVTSFIAVNRQSLEDIFLGVVHSPTFSSLGVGAGQGLQFRTTLRRK